MNAYVRTYISVILLMGIVGAVSACDNPVDEDHHEPVEAAGLALVSEGEELLRVQDAQASDTLVVPLGGQTPAVDVEFLDEDGARIHEEDFGDEFSLRWEIDDDGVVTFTSEGRWSFTASGNAEGETVAEMQLFHGDHHDFIAQFPVRVE